MKYTKFILTAIVTLCTTIANAEVDTGELEAALREVRSNPKSPAVSTVAEAKRMLDETIAQKKAQEEAERKAAAKLRDDHRTTLRNIKNMDPSPEAINALHEFLGKNPDSPVAEEFRLAEPEIVAEIVKKREAEKHKKYLRIGLISAAAVVFLLWCIAFARLNIFVKVVRRGEDDL